MVLSFAKGDANNINTQDSLLQTQEPIPIWQKISTLKSYKFKVMENWYLLQKKMIFWPKAVIRICYMMKKWENSNYDLKIDCYQAIGRDNICNFFAVKSSLISVSMIWEKWFARWVVCLEKSPLRCSESSGEYIQRVRFLVCSGSKGI